MAIPYQGQLTVLQGLPTSFPQQLLLHIALVDATDQAEPDLQPLLVELQSLLDAYSDLFQPPTPCHHPGPMIIRYP